MVELAQQKKVEQPAARVDDLASTKATMPSAGIDVAELQRNREFLVAKAEKGYTSPNPSNIAPGQKAEIRTNDGQAQAVEKWLQEAKLARRSGESAGAIVFTDINGTKYGLHHAGDPAPRGTHYNIACFNEHSHGQKFRVEVGINNPLDPNTTITVRKGS